MPKVQLFVYDISQGMAKQMSMALVGKQVDYIPHTGIVVFGNEYFFQSQPTVGVPGQSVPIPACEVIELGETSKTREELDAYIQAELVHEFCEEKYVFLTHNCNHYADAIAKFLLNGAGIPSKIVNIAEEALSEPQAQPLRLMIENMEKSMRTQGGGSALNPFGNAGASGGVPMRADMPAMSPSVSAPVAAAAATPVENEDLKAAIADIQSNEKEAQRNCLTTLVKITENVQKNPVDPKFRKIKMSNAAFKKKVVDCNGGVEAMLAIGWNPDSDPDGEDVWILGDEHAGSQSGPLKKLSEALAKLGPAPGAAPAPTQQAPAAGLGAGGMPGGGFGGLGMPNTGGGYGGMGGGLGGLPPGGLPPGMANNPMMQQMMNNPAMMQQAQQMMSNPQMMAQAQQMMNNPQAMAQMQQMMSDPNAMAQLQNMMGGPGGV